MMLSHKLEQEDMYNEYRPDIASNTPTMTTTSTVSIPATESYTDSIFHSYDENSDLKKAIAYVSSLLEKGESLSGQEESPYIEEYLWSCKRI